MEGPRTPGKDATNVDQLFFLWRDNP